MNGLTNKQLQSMYEKQDEVLRKRFEQAGRSRQLKVTNWVAPTGIGYFDAVYDLANNRYDIKIKVFFDLIDGDSKRGFIPWDETAKREFKQKAKQVVEENWSERYLITCAKPGWEQYYVKVKVHVIDEPVKSNAHIHLEVSRRPDSAKSQGGGVLFTANPPKCDIDSLAILTKEQSSIQEGIFNMRERMLMEALKSCQCEVISFDHKSSDISIESRLKLMNFAQYVGRVNSGDVKGIQIHIYGASSGRSIWGTGKKRAKAVRDFLVAKIPSAANMFHATDSVSGTLKTKVIETLKRVLREPTRTNTRASGAVIVVHTPEDVERLAVRNYIVLVHEFGHVLGLPDEYFGRLHPKLTQKIGLNTIIPSTIRNNFTAQKGLQDERRKEHHEGMAKMHDKAGGHVPMPMFITQGESLTEDVQKYTTVYREHTQKYQALVKEYGRGSEETKVHQRNAPVAPLGLGSSSIMYGGMDILPAHYLTIWSSLAEATKEYLAPEDWKIVPDGRKHPGSLRLFQ